VIDRRVARLGDRALRFPRPEGVPGDVLAARVLAWPGVVDAIVCERDVAALFGGEPRLPDGALDALAEPQADARAPRHHAIRVTYDGVDLEDVAHACGLSADEVVQLHAGAEYEVRFLGFLPGFAYLGGLHPRLRVPRRAVPRPRVPAGAVAIGAEYTGIYPFPSPGGWHVLGRTTARLFDAERGALLAPGDRVRFVAEAR
jgi:UPF0271 protein